MRPAASVPRWLRAVKMVRPRAPLPAGTCGRRAVLVHLDGVSLRAIVQAMRTGHAPFLARLLESRTHALSPYLVGAPASTSAFQSGLLYGHVDDVPGYLWYDKRTHRDVRMDRGVDTERAEKRHALRGPGLLAGGSSYTTLFRGDAASATFNLSGVRELRWNSNFRHWPLHMALPVQMAVGARIWGRLMTEALPEILETFSWATHIGRFDWEGRLLGLKLLTGIPLREAATFGTVGDIARGVPLVYTCLVDYDEVAHRRGPRSAVAMRLLRATDDSVRRIFEAAAAFPEHRYDVYVFGDHGMTDTVPFAALDGRDLPAMLGAAVDGETHASARDHALLRSWGDWLPPPVGWALHEAARRKAAAPPGIEIIDAGDIAHLYDTEIEEPLPWDAFERRRPRIAAALRGSSAIPFLLARGRNGDGAVVVTGDRVRHLDDETDRAAIADHPALRGPEAAQRVAYLERVIGMRSSGDVVLYGNAGDRTIAFSWEFGSHGGIAPDETDSFMVHPAEAPFDFAAVRLPEQLHRFFVRYRPPLPAAQRVLDDVEARPRDPRAVAEAAAAVATGRALADVSDDTLHSGCP